MGILRHLARWVAPGLLAVVVSAASLSAELESRVIIVGAEEAGQFELAAAKVRSALASREDIRVESAKLSDMARTGPRRLPATDVLVPMGTQAARIAIRDRGEARVVFAMVLNPVPALVESYEAPPEGVTGACLNVRPEDVLEVIERLLPRVRRLGILYDPGQNESSVAEIGRAVEQRKLSLETRQVRSEGELEKSLRTLLGSVDLVWALPDSKVYSPTSAQVVLRSAIAARVPVLGFSRGMAAAGALVSVSPDFEACGRQAGELILQSLEAPATERLPILRPFRLRVVVNRRVEQLLDVRIEESGSGLVEEWLQ